MSGVTRATFVASSLHQIIVAGQYAPGQQLPSEGELAEQFGVSRAVIRDATKLLVGQDILASVRGRGVFVRNVPALTTVTLPILTSASIRSLYETRRALEIAVVKLALIRSKRADLAKLRRIMIRAQRCVAEERDVTHLLRYDDQFHRTLAVCAHNEVLLQLLDDLRHLLVMARLRSLQIDGRPQQSVAEHERIVRTLEQRDIDGAVAAMYIHLTSVEASLVQSVEAEGSALPLTHQPTPGGE